jgi:uncharacterized protein
MATLIGRNLEKAELETLKSSDKSAFVAVYGRRRVGKTFLIRRVFEREMNFQVTGLANVGLRPQLANFYAAIAKQFELSPSHPMPKNWFGMFLLLSDCLEKTNTDKKVIFLDELPWFDSPQSGFISALEHFWNSWASAREDVILITCGSAAAWMVNQLLNNHGGLHNRVTHRIRLHPFTLAECEAFFLDRNISFDRYQLIQLYMAIGGIPFYLDRVKQGWSATQNINHLAFGPDSILRTEYNNLYASLFKKAERHIAVVEALAKKGKGLTRVELLSLVNATDSGQLTKVLRELEESNFIRRYNDFGKKKQSGIYQLCDFYTLFYLRFIKESDPADTNFWNNSLDDPSIRAWSGYAFEQVCLAHIPCIKQALGIEGIQTQTSAWANPQAQIDLVIDRRDHVISLIEIKFSIHSFVIDKAYADQLRVKVAAFRNQTNTKKSIFLTLLTTYGVTSNAHSGSLQNSFDMNILFAR